jgi:hypothetical protein
VGRWGGPPATVVIVLPFLGLFVLVDFAAPELFAGRGEDHPMPGRFKGVEKIVGESERLIETCFRGRDVHQQPLVGLEIIPLVDLTAGFKMGLGIAYEAVGTGDALGYSTRPGLLGHRRFDYRRRAEVAILRPEEFIARLRFWKWLGWRRLPDGQFCPIAPLGPRHPK